MASSFRKALKKNTQIPSCGQRPPKTKTNCRRFWAATYFFFLLSRLFLVVINILHISHFKSPFTSILTKQKASCSATKPQKKKTTAQAKNHKKKIEGKKRWLMLVMRHVASHAWPVAYILKWAESWLRRRMRLRLWTEVNECKTRDSKKGRIMKCGAVGIQFFLYKWADRQRTGLSSAAPNSEQKQQRQWRLKISSCNSAQGQECSAMNNSCGYAFGEYLHWEVRPFCGGLMAQVEKANRRKAAAATVNNHISRQRTFHRFAYVCTYMHRYICT